MGDMFKLIWWVIIALFRSRASLEAMIPMLRLQSMLCDEKSNRIRAARGLNFTCVAILFAGAIEARAFGGAGPSIRVVASELDQLF
jgi:hypothetical protein